MFCQSLLRKKHGHYDTVHAAICTGHNENGPMIAHVTVVPNQKSAYQHEPLQAMLDRENGDRPFMIYRPHDTLIANGISQFAKEVTPIEKFKWSIFSAATSLAYCPKFQFGSKNSSATKEISSDTFCSRFVIQVMKKAYQQYSTDLSTRHNYDNLSGRSTPKALESFLSKQNDYQKLCYIGKNPYQDVLNEVQKQLVRLSAKQDKLSHEKYTRAENTLRDTLNDMENNIFLLEGDKVRYLFKAMLPVFKENTGWNLSNPTSYTALAGLARNMGIFKRDIQLLRHEPSATVAPRNAVDFSYSAF
jgi:cell fate (sporulation/competence/biofilm development) regulator YlbF (YheA/YmcA/DUF963 family)